MIAQPKQRRVFWGKELTQRVYDEVRKLWASELTRPAMWQAAQAAAGIPENLRRPFAGRISVELVTLFGRKPSIGKRRKPSAEAPPAEPLRETPLPPVPAIELPPSFQPLPEGPIAYVDPKGNATCTDCAAEVEAERQRAQEADDLAAVGRTVMELVGAFESVLTRAIAKAITSPAFAQTLSEVLGRTASAPSATAARLERPAHDPYDPHAPMPDRPANPPRNAPRARLPRILVAGLLPSQISEVRRAFHGRADLRFWKSSDAAALLRKQCESVDAGVGWVRFMGHSAEAILKSKAPTYVPANGGITQLTDRIEHALKIVTLEAAGHVAN